MKSARVRECSCLVWTWSGSYFPVDRSGQYPVCVCHMLTSSIMQAALDLTLDYTHDRQQFGKPIGTFQLMQGKLAGQWSIMRRLTELTHRYVYQALGFKGICLCRGKSL